MRVIADNQKDNDMTIWHFFKSTATLC